jgi:hypothetical protein
MQSLARTSGWPEAEGRVHTVTWDSSYPREEIAYAYSTESGYHAGHYWRWFDSSDMQNVQVGDSVVVLYNPEDQDKSVFLRFG